MALPKALLFCALALLVPAHANLVDGTQPALMRRKPKTESERVQAQNHSNLAVAEKVVEKAGEKNLAMEEIDAEEDHEDESEEDAAGRRRRRRKSRKKTMKTAQSGSDDRRSNAGSKHTHLGPVYNCCKNCRLKGTAWNNCLIAAQDHNRRRVKLSGSRRRRGKCVHPKPNGMFEYKDKDKWCSCLSRLFGGCKDGMACLNGGNRKSVCSCKYMCGDFKKELGCTGSLLSSSRGGQEIVATQVLADGSLDEVLAGKRTCG